jgi:hypothetical protein
MSSYNSRVILEKRLASMADSLPTVWPNTAYTPQAGVAYQTVDYRTQGSRIVAYGDKPHTRESENMIITLHYPPACGAGSALTYAQCLQAWFPAGWGEISAGEQVQISHTPTVTSTRTTNEGFHVVLKIPFTNDQR